LPDQPKTPIRGVRIPDDLWRSAQDKAAAEGTTVSEVVRDCLARWVGITRPS
jgi:hypothetical protein